MDHARGFDCSSYQGDINWAAVADDFSFVFIRASAGQTPDEKYARNYDGAHEQGLLCGAYHYLRQELDRQAQVFYDAVGDRIPELGYYGDLEQTTLTADKCRLFLETMDTKTQEIQGWESWRPTGIYTSASFFNKFGTPSWTSGRKLWVAHWDVAEPTLPNAWAQWEFWQTTNHGVVAGKTMDLDEYNGDLDDLLDEYGPEEPPPPPPPEGTVKVYDMNGTLRDWAWVQTTYGLVEILPADGYRVVQLNEIEGPMAFTCTLLSEAGAPVPGQQVAYIWPDGEQIEVTNSNGVAEHSAGAGEGYAPPGPGPISWEVRSGTSDMITGLGWLLGTNHRHLQVTMRMEGDEPPPPDDWQADTTARLERIEQLLIHVHGHLGPDATFITDMPVSLD
jgi:lysozyme